MKKILSIVVCVAIIMSLFAVNFSASALVNTKTLYGDANGDKVVDTSDAKIALKAAAGLGSLADSSAKKRCDINGDGAVTLYDARQILRSCADIVELQPKGNFTGFDGGGVFATESEAIKYFNTNLNKVKSSMAGFTRTDKAEVKTFDIEDVSFIGVTLGNTAASLVQSIEDSLKEETEPEEIFISIKDENCDNAMSVETETYVSNLKSSGVLGIKCVKKPTEGTITIKIALPNCDVENISHTAVGDVLNARLVQEKSQNALTSVFGKVDGEDAIRNRVENCVLTAVFDTKTGKVVSYTTKYETELYIPSSTIGVTGGNLTAQLKGIQYTTAYTVTYTDFEW